MSSKRKHVWSAGRWAHAASGPNSEYERRIAALARQSDAYRPAAPSGDPFAAEGDGGAEPVSGPDIATFTETRAGEPGLEPSITPLDSGASEPSLAPASAGLGNGAALAGSGDGLASLLSVQEQSLDLLRRIAENTASTTGVVGI